MSKTVLLLYYAHPTGRILSFLDRAFYSCAREGCAPFRGKPGAAVVSARRGGTTAALDVLNKYFAIAGMPTAPSTYWNMVHGQSPGDVARDLEGLQTMRNLGRNLAHMVLNGGALPPQETGARTDFIQP